MDRFAIVVGRFNAEVTGGLLAGAREYLAQQSTKVADGDVVYAPGAFEIPLIAKSLAKTGRYAGVICLGAVIKGETAHFEFISLGATIGLMQAGLETGVPITFGILTAYDDAQAAARSGTGADAMSNNKGREAAAACFESVRTLQAIRENK
ncbi:MAG: 6,7-dimethyl-8-ribityllumazine synthase [Deltaproteobacteria bacterium]|nr:6,7-dimethyl-8-ribityllumazine synthase [Deltaproteobacteria bacterium]